MSRIAVISDWWNPNLVGGAEISALEVANLLAKSYDVVVFTVGRSSLHKAALDDFEIVYTRGLVVRKNVQTIFLIKAFEKIRTFIDGLTPLLISKKVKSFDPDVILLHQVDRIGVLIFPILKSLMPEVPQIRVFHDLGDSCLTRNRFKNGKICVKTCISCRPREFMHRTFLKRYVTQSISNSRFTATKLQSLGFNMTKNLVGHPIPFDSGSSLRREVRCSSKFRENFHDIGFVGRVTEEKGVEEIIHALSNSDSKYRLHIVGRVSARYEGYLRDLGADLGVKLDFYGMVAKPYELLFDKVSTIVVASRWEEPFGRVVMESALHGIPCLVSNRGGLSESSEFIFPSPQIFDPDKGSELLEILERRQNIEAISVTFNSRMTLTQTVESAVHKLLRSED